MRRPAPARAAAATPPAPAFRYVAGKVGARNGRIIGMQMATESFFLALLRHLDPPVLSIFAHTDDDYAEALAHLDEVGWAAKRVRRVAQRDERALAALGAVLMNDPGMHREAAARKDPRAFSFVGMTHSLSSYRSWREIFSYASAPLQPWDALICTSTAAREVVERLLADAEEALRAKGIEGAMPRPALPIIPLGVDAAALAPDAAARARWRARLGAGEDDVVALFVGRLSFHAKAHPAAMFAAVAAAAGDLPMGVRLRLALLGNAANEPIEQAFRAAAALHAPGVTVDFLAGPTSDDRREALAGADLFISLADSVQETFGLSPVEAMAAGLPVVVTDWNGYRDTVRDGIDGFRIATTMAPPPAVSDGLVDDLGEQKVSYDRFCSIMGLLVAVDQRATAAAIRTLAVDPDRRRAMGAAAMAEVRRRFDWPVVIEAHRALWTDLAAERRRAPVARAVRALRDLKPSINPLSLFATFPTAILAGAERVALTVGPEAARAALAGLASDDTFNHALSMVPPAAELAAMVDAIHATPGMTVAALVRDVPREQRRRTLRGVMLMLKRGLLARLPA